MDPRTADVDYWEINGALEPREGKSVARNAVVLSNIVQGEQSSAGVFGVTIRFVARGRENYRIGGKACRLEPGQVMVAPHHLGSDCEIRRVDRAGTLGVCTLIRDPQADLHWLKGPLILSGRQSRLGALMSDSASRLLAGQQSKLGLAHRLIAGLKAELPGVRQGVLAQAAAVDGAKPSTRFEMVRRANLARAYLDATVDHAVDLTEVAAVAGISPFRLLAAFQQCFGETPAAYHRKLRLQLALAECRRRDVPIAAVADEFGFAGGSSFSHAYRRVFGHAPVWNKSEAA